MDEGGNPEIAAALAKLAERDSAAADDAGAAFATCARRRPAVLTHPPVPRWLLNTPGPTKPWHHRPCPQLVVPDQ